MTRIPPREEDSLTNLSSGRRVPSARAVEQRNAALNENPPNIQGALQAVQPEEQVLDIALEQPAIQQAQEAIQPEVLPPLQGGTQPFPYPYQVDPFFGVNALPVNQGQPVLEPQNVDILSKVSQEVSLYDNMPSRPDVDMLYNRELPRLYAGDGLDTSVPDIVDIRPRYTAANAMAPGQGIAGVNSLARNALIGRPFFADTELPNVQSWVEGIRNWAQSDNRAAAVANGLFGGLGARFRDASYFSARAVSGDLEQGEGLRTAVGIAGTLFNTYIHRNIRRLREEGVGSVVAANTQALANMIRRGGAALVEQAPSIAIGALGVPRLGNSDVFNDVSNWIKPVTRLDTESTFAGLGAAAQLPFAGEEAARIYTEAERRAAEGRPQGFFEEAAQRNPDLMRVIQSLEPVRDGDGRAIINPYRGQYGEFGSAGSLSALMYLANIPEATATGLVYDLADMYREGLYRISGNEAYRAPDITRQNLDILSGLAGRDRSFMQTYSESNYLSFVGNPALDRVLPRPLQWGAGFLADMALGGLADAPIDAVIGGVTASRRIARRGLASVPDNAVNDIARIDELISNAVSSGRAAPISQDVAETLRQVGVNPTANAVSVSSVGGNLNIPLQNRQVFNTTSVTRQLDEEFTSEVAQLTTEASNRLADVTAQIRQLEELRRTAEQAAQLDAVEIDNYTTSINNLYKRARILQEALGQNYRDYTSLVVNDAAQRGIVNINENGSLTTIVRDETLDNLLPPVDARQLLPTFSNYAEGLIRYRNEPESLIGSDFYMVRRDNTTLLNLAKTYGLASPTELSASPHLMRELSNEFPDLLSTWGRQIPDEINAPLNRVILQQADPIQATEEITSVVDNPPSISVNVVPDEGIPVSARRRLNSLRRRFEDTAQELFTEINSNTVNRGRRLASAVRDLYRQYPQLGREVALDNLPEMLQPRTPASRQLAEGLILTEETFHDEARRAVSLRRQLREVDEIVEQQEEVVRNLPPLERTPVVDEAATRSMYGDRGLSPSNSVNNEGLDSLNPTEYDTLAMRELEPNSVDSFSDYQRGLLEDYDNARARQFTEDELNAAFDRLPDELDTRQFRQIFSDMSRGEQDALLFALQRQGRIDVGTLQETGVDAGLRNSAIPQNVGGPIAFITKESPEEVVTEEAVSQGVRAANARFSNLNRELNADDYNILKNTYEENEIQFALGPNWTRENNLLPLARRFGIDESLSNKEIYNRVAFVDDTFGPLANIPEKQRGQIVQDFIDAIESQTTRQGADLTDEVRNFAAMTREQRKAAMQSADPSLEQLFNRADEIFDNPLYDDVRNVTDISARRAANQIVDETVGPAIRESMGVVDLASRRAARQARELTEETWYHGTKANLPGMELGPTQSSLTNEFGIATYLTDSRNVAQTYARAMPAIDKVDNAARTARVVPEGTVYEVGIKQNANIVTQEQLQPILYETLVDLLDEEDGTIARRFRSWAKKKEPLQYLHYVRSQYRKLLGEGAADGPYRSLLVDVQRTLQEKGIDGVRYSLNSDSSAIAIFNPNALRTKGRILDTTAENNIMEGLLNRYKADLQMHQMMDNATTNAILESDRLQIDAYARQQLRKATAEQGRISLDTTRQMVKQENELFFENLDEAKRLDKRVEQEAIPYAVRQSKKEIRRVNPTPQRVGFENSTAIADEPWRTLGLPPIDNTTQARQYMRELPDMQAEYLIKQHKNKKRLDIPVIQADPEDVLSTANIREAVDEARAKGYRGANDYEILARSTSRRKPENANVMPVVRRTPLDEGCF